VLLSCLSHQQRESWSSHRLVERHINCIFDASLKLSLQTPQHCFLASLCILQDPGTEWRRHFRSCMIAPQCDRTLAPSGSREGGDKGSQEGCGKGGPTAGRVEQLRMSLEQQLGPSKLLAAHRCPFSLGHLPFPASHSAH